MVLVFITSSLLSLVIARPVTDTFLDFGISSSGRYFTVSYRGGRLSVFDLDKIYDPFQPVEVLQLDIPGLPGNIQSPQISIQYGLISVTEEEYFYDEDEHSSKIWFCSIGDKVECSDFGVGRQLSGVMNLPDFRHLILVKPGHLELFDRVRGKIKGEVKVSGKWRPIIADSDSPLAAFLVKRNGKESVVVLNTENLLHITEITLGNRELQQAIFTLDNDHIAINVKEEVSDRYIRQIEVHPLSISDGGKPGSSRRIDANRIVLGDNKTALWYARYTRAQNSKNNPIRCVLYPSTANGYLESDKGINLAQAGFTRNSGTPLYVSKPRNIVIVNGFHSEQYIYSLDNGAPLFELNFSEGSPYVPAQRPVDVWASFIPRLPDEDSFEYDLRIDKKYANNRLFKNMSSFDNRSLFASQRLRWGITTLFKDWMKYTQEDKRQLILYAKTLTVTEQHYLPLWFEIQKTIGEQTDSITRSKLDAIVDGLGLLDRLEKILANGFVFLNEKNTVERIEIVDQIDTLLNNIRNIEQQEMDLKKDDELSKIIDSYMPLLKCWLLETLGRTLIYSGDNANAEVAFKKAIKYNPSYWRALEGILWLTMDDNKDHFKKVLSNISQRLHIESLSTHPKHGSPTEFFDRKDIIAVRRNIREALKKGD